MNIFKRAFPSTQDHEKDSQIRLQLDESYANMVNTMAWKDLEIFMNEIASQSIKDHDNIPIGNLGLAEAAEGRGIRKAIEKIRKQISFHVRDEGE